MSARLDGAARARENAYHDEMQREESAYFRNRSLKPPVLWSRLTHFIGWRLFLEPYGRLRGWW
jgi:hypothetical protein